MLTNILYSPYGQIGLVLLFVITIVVLVRIFEKRARKQSRKSKSGKFHS